MQHALGSLDVIYAHSRTATFLSTRFSDGVVNARGYDDRGSEAHPPINISAARLCC